MDCIDHLECILPEGYDLERGVNAVLKAVYENGREPAYVVGSPSLKHENPMKGMVLAVGHTDGLQVVCAYDNRKEKLLLSSFYPIGKPMRGIVPRRGVCHFFESQNDLEAYGTLRGDTLLFSVANYPSLRIREEYKNRLPFNVDVVGFCYLCKKVDKDRKVLESSRKIGEDMKVSLDMTCMKFFTQNNDVFPDEFRFASPVYDLDELAVFGLPMYRMKIMTNEACFDGEEDEYITVYAKKMIFPDGLKKGDFVMGTGWLQGIFRNF